MCLANSVEDDDVVLDIVPVLKARCPGEKNERKTWPGRLLRLGYGVEGLALFLCQPSCSLWFPSIRPCQWDSLGRGVCSTTALLTPPTRSDSHILSSPLECVCLCPH